MYTNYLDKLIKYLKATKIYYEGNLDCEDYEKGMLLKKKGNKFFLLAMAAVLPLPAT